jgi:hypothetical protein
MIPGLGTNFLPVSVEKITRHSWKRHIRRAFRENDPDKLLRCVHAAEGAMFYRWQESAVGHPVATEERAEMLKACDELLGIKIHKLGWPGARGL